MCIILLTAILFSLTVKADNMPKCSVGCDCTRSTLQCNMCLKFYGKTIAQSNNECICLDGLVERQPPGQYCCPKHCKQCFIDGCISCQDKWQVIYSSQYQLYKCDCKANYYYDQDKNDCFCSSQKYPTEYFYNNQTGCAKCPLNCTCSQNGCISCYYSTNRIIQTTIYNQSTCNCSYPYVQNIDGTCLCVSGCQCINSSISCPAQTNRELIKGEWKCKTPYVQVNNTCICQSPYAITTIIQPNQCLCQSKSSVKNFYQMHQSCHICPLGCNCDQRGCIYCRQLTNRQVNQGTCQCKHPYKPVLIFQVQLCLCLWPYYNRTIDSDSNCMCMSNYYPLQYYFDNETQQCNQCPEDCSCSSSGCVLCNTNANRNIVINNQGISTCYCQDLYIQNNRKCICKAPYIQVNGSCVCASNYYPTLIYYTSDINLCIYCPYGCTCNPLGCVVCKDQAYRSINTSSSGQSTCSCAELFQQNQLGVCVCKFSYTLNLTLAKCECQQPYQINNNSECVCKSYVNNTLYYLSVYQNQTTCYKCPVQCRCDSNGCVQCGPNTMRYIQSTNYTYKVCPCYQNAILVGDYCTICQINQYYIDGSCMKCSGNCKTCDINGCTSCTDQTTLSNNQCLCKNSNLVNLNGICGCFSGLYLNQNICSACPLYCKACVLQQYKVNCLSCYQNVFRLGLPQYNCHCQQGYVQSYPIKKFCCHKSCMTCNQEGCLSCPKYSNRDLDSSNNANITCVCGQNFTQQNGTANCICQQTFHLYANQCLPCPKYCYNCEFNISINKIVCLSCSENMNRQMDSPTCQCLSRYLQSYPKQSYCYPVYCAQPNYTCNNCLFQHIPSQNQRECVCQLDHYEGAVAGTCAPCMPGCQYCTVSYVCKHCNMSQGYYLFQKACQLMEQKLNFIYVQDFTGITIQTVLVQMSRNQSSVSIRTAGMRRFVLQLESSDVVKPTTTMKVLYSRMVDKTLQLRLQNPEQSFLNSILQINWIQNDKSSSSLTFSSSGYKYFMIDIQLPNNVMNKLSQPSLIALLVFIIILMILALIIYQNGFKQNQIMFYLQTLSFTMYNVQDPNHQIIFFLYYFKTACYQFGVNNVSPFTQALSKIDPSMDYLQSSYGNFKTTSHDANIIRNVGMALFLLILIIIFNIIFRVLDLVIAKPQIKQIIKKYKKPVYRLGEFFYKTTMYPIVFFSLSTIIYFKTTYIFSQNPSFRLICLILSIVLLVGYSCMTVYQVFFEDTSKLSRYQSGLQFLFDVISSLIILYTIHSKLLALLTIVFIVRGVMQILLRKHSILKFQKVGYLKIGFILFEVLSVLFIVINQLTGLIVSFILAVLLQLITTILVMHKNAKNYEFEKKPNDIFSSQSDMIIRIPKNHSNKSQAE